MCASIRFPEAIPLSNSKAKTIIKALTILFLLLWVFLKQFCQIRDPILFLNSQSQGALERFHHTLKNMMKTFCLDSHKDWDNGVRMLQLAVRESFQESLCFTSFELVFEHSMGGP